MFRVGAWDVVGGVRFEMELVGSGVEIDCSMGTDGLLVVVGGSVVAPSVGDGVGGSVVALSGEL